MAQDEHYNEVVEGIELLYNNDFGGADAVFARHEQQIPRYALHYGEVRKALPGDVNVLFFYSCFFLPFVLALHRCCAGGIFAQLHHGRFGRHGGGDNAAESRHRVVEAISLSACCGRA